MFAPDALRDLAPAEKLGAEPAVYVKLDGLGKIAYSSIKRPRPLMDLIAEPVKGGVGPLSMAPGELSKSICSKKALGQI
jgi:hypothetical protein